MNELHEGLPVRDIRGRLLGTVAAQFSCCIRLRDGRAVRRDGILAADEMGVELICDGNQLERYSCPLHAPLLPAK